MISGLEERLREEAFWKYEYVMESECDEVSEEKEEGERDGEMKDIVDIERLE